jgi:hypothetical protein
VLLILFNFNTILISYINIIVKSDEDIFIAVSKIDRHFKASYFSVYKMKRLRQIEKKCLKLNVPNYQFLIFDESYISSPEDENEWMQKL